MLQGRAVELDVPHVAARIFHRLGDGSRHFARLATAEADATLAVTHHGQRGEAEDTATLHDLGDATRRGRRGGGAGAAGGGGGGARRDGGPEGGGPGSR